MGSEAVVIDNTDIPAILKDAGIEPEKAPEKPKEAKPDPKPEVKAEKPKPDHEGLTEEERKTYTESMRKSVAWRHGKMKEAQEQAERDRQGRMTAEERLRAVEKELEQAKLQPRAATAPEASKEPKREDFQDEAAYQTALIDYRVEQKFSAKAADEAKEREKAYEKELLATANAKIAKAKELVPDFAEVTGSVDVPVPSHIGGYMARSPLLAELGYHFAQHPDEFEPIARMPVRTIGEAMQLGVALGKIESKLKPFGETHSKSEPKAEANGASTKPSTEADGIPSRPRVSVPVVQPLTARGAPEVEAVSTVDGRKAVASYEKRTGANLTRRARH